jgi:hypothetical protein
MTDYKVQLFSTLTNHIKGLDGEGSFPGQAISNFPYNGSAVHRGMFSLEIYG